MRSITIAILYIIVYFCFSGYLIVAPRKIRATSVYSVHVSIYKMYSTYTYVRATLSQDGVEYAREVRKYLETGSKTLDMLVRRTAG